MQVWVCSDDSRANCCLLIHCFKVTIYNQCNVVFHMSLDLIKTFDSRYKNLLLQIYFKIRIFLNIHCYKLSIPCTKDNHFTKALRTLYPDLPLCGISSRLGGTNCIRNLAWYNTHRILPRFQTRIPHTYYGRTTLGHNCDWEAPLHMGLFVLQTCRCRYHHLLLPHFRHTGPKPVMPRPGQKFQK